MCKLFLLKTSSKPFAAFALVLTIAASCMQSKRNQPEEKVSIHGHRGCRGDLPENTIAGFVSAFENGVDAIELDVVLTADHEVLVSHDPFMHHEICAYPDSTRIDEKDEMSLNIFQMTLDSAKTYPCGGFPHPRFPEQKQVPDVKPTLKAVVNAVRELAKVSDFPEPLWNIEIKSEPQWDNIYHPSPNEYVDIFLRCFNELHLNNNAIIQSFDPRILNELHQHDPKLKLVLLSDDETSSPEQKLNTLAFIPYGYSPNFKLINEEVVGYCNDRKLVLIAWTVNEEQDIRKMMHFGVKHIISDYPGLAIKIRDLEK